MFGYFESNSASPTFDPGVNIPCLLCKKALSAPMKTISFMRADARDRSYFYRTHKDCYETAEQLEPHKIREIEGGVIDLDVWPDVLGH